MSHDPNAHEHGPHEPQGHDDPVASLLSKAQYLVTAVLLGGVAALMYNAGVQSTKGHGGEGATPAAHTAVAVDVHALLTPSDALVTKGKSLFAINCASCHGTGGQGDGPAAAALNPKPRNFTETYWRYGGGPARIVQTITNGSPGTAMAAFPSIPLEDRFAIAHFVRTLSPKPDTDKAEDLSWLDQFGGGPKAGAGETAAAGGPAPAGPTIPVEKALALLAVAPDPVGVPASAEATGEGEGGEGSEGGEGRELYALRCASCHGMAGEGGVRTRMIGSAPYAYVVTRSLGAPGGEWASNAARFQELILRGLEGYVMPGNGDLSRSQLRDLYQYTQTLRARQEAAGRSRS
jgi:mono/diheme cytochrome c family protein